MTIIVCDRPVPGAELKSEPVDGKDKCPHCHQLVELEHGYGLAAGPCGSYAICPECGEYCNHVEDLGP